MARGPVDLDVFRRAYAAEFLQSALLLSSLTSSSCFSCRGAFLPVRDGLLCFDTGVTADILWLSAFRAIAFWAVIIARRTRFAFCFLGSGVAGARQPRWLGAFTYGIRTQWHTHRHWIIGLVCRISSRWRGTRAWGVEGLDRLIHIYTDIRANAMKAGEPVPGKRKANKRAAGSVRERRFESQGVCI